MTHFSVIMFDSFIVFTLCLLVFFSSFFKENSLSRSYSSPLYVALLHLFDYILLNVCCYLDCDCFKL